MRIPVRWVLATGALITTLLCGSFVQAQLPNYISQDAFPGLSFSAPVCIAAPPGETNRLFIVEQSGVIVVITNLANPTRSVFLDISDRVDDGGEKGLLGLAFHPGFASNNFFYVFYTGQATNGSPGLHDILSRFRAWTAPWDPNMADPDSEVRLIAQRDEADNHNGGDIHFGPDNYLYVSLGDEGGGDDEFHNSQRIDQDFFAGILRIDVDKRPGSLAPKPHPALGPTANYGIPPNNPFVGVTTFNGSSINTASLRTEFWAVGLRNPWRLSFDPPTGLLYCGDVGQNAREEIDIISKGENYGWNYREGKIDGPRSSPPGAFDPTGPILDYDRGVGNCIIGGVVYRGDRFPDLMGYYFYADFGSGRVWAFQYDGVNAPTPQQLFIDQGISAFGVDPRNGDVLYAHLFDSMIKRIVPEVPTGSLRVTIQPSSAINDGAKWRVDGGALRTSGTTAAGLSEGDHVVSYRTIAGWNAPADQTVTVVADSTTTANGVYVAIDFTKPTCAVTSPDPGERVTNAVITASGTARDNIAVSVVFYQLNGGGWTIASTANGFTNWLAPDLPLTPGTNVIRAFAVDASGNISTTNRVSFVYVVTSPLSLFINGRGTVEPNLNGRALEVGRRYTLTAKPGKDFAFGTWSGDVSTNTVKLAFTMQPNLLLIANFRDAKRPVLMITSPAANQRVSTPVLTVTGKAKDNVGVNWVIVTVNGLNWSADPVTTTNAFTNWVATGLVPITGVNVVRAQATDSFNTSLTAVTKFTYTPAMSADWAPDGLSGLMAEASPDSGGSLSLSFDAFQFNRTGSSSDNFGIGNYIYEKTGTNTAHLAMMTRAPVSRTNDPPFDVTLTFTNQYQGTFTGSDSGVISFSIAPLRVPESFSKKKLILRSDGGTNITSVSFSDHGTFSQKPSLTGASSVSSGSFLLWRYSPIADFIALRFLGPEDGNITELQLTFTSKTAGIYQITTWTGPATVVGTDSGTFTLQNL